MLTFFDVDQTLIDSDARLADSIIGGVFNVEHYRNGQTDDNLMRDKPLPLLAAALASNVLQTSYILTAREMLPADFRQFKRLGLECLHVYHRGNAPEYIASMQNNGEYKQAYLEHLRLVEFPHVRANASGLWARIYDDDKGVLKNAPLVGVMPYDAVKINAILSRQNKAA